MTHADPRRPLLCLLHREWMPTPGVMRIINMSHAAPRVCNEPAPSVRPMTTQPRPIRRRLLAGALCSSLILALAACQPAPDVAQDASRARRLMTLSSVERLRHMAEQEWERFTTDHPRPGYWSPSEWTERRTRRLSSLEKRTAELGQARKQASSEALQALDRAIEGHADALLRRCASAPKAERPAGNSAALPDLGLYGSPKPPRLH